MNRDFRNFWPLVCALAFIAWLMCLANTTTAVADHCRNLTTNGYCEGPGQGQTLYCYDRNGFLCASGPATQVTPTPLNECVHDSDTGMDECDDCGEQVKAECQDFECASECIDETCYEMCMLVPLNDPYECGKSCCTAELSQLACSGH